MLSKAVLLRQTSLFQGRCATDTIHTQILPVTDMLAHCTQKFRSIHFLSFLSATITKQQEAASISPILRYQGYTKPSLLPIHPTKILMKGICQ